MQGWKYCVKSIWHKAWNLVSAESLWPKKIRLIHQTFNLQKDNHLAFSQCNSFRVESCSHGDIWGNFSGDRAMMSSGNLFSFFFRVRSSRSWSQVSAYRTFFGWVNQIACSARMYVLLKSFGLHKVSFDVSGVYLPFPIKYYVAFLN